MIKLSTILEDLASTAVMRKREVPYQTYTPEEYGDPQEKIQDEEVEPGNFIPYVPAEESVEEGAEEDALKGTRTEIPIMEKQKQSRMKNEIKRMQEIAGIAQEADLSMDAYQRMDGLVGQKDLKTFTAAADNILRTLHKEGFDGYDILEYLVSRIRYIKNYH